MQTYKILPKEYRDLEDFHPLEQSAIFLADALLSDVNERKKRIMINSQIEILKNIPDSEFLEKGMNLDRFSAEQKAALAKSKKLDKIAEWEALL